jgi:hypothetical protein
MIVETGYLSRVAQRYVLYRFTRLIGRLPSRIPYDDSLRSTIW